MFAPKVAKPQTKAAEASTIGLARNGSTLVAHRPGNDRSGRPQETTVDPDARAASRLSWSFGSIRVTSHDRANGSQIPSPLSAPPTRTLAVGKVNDPLEDEADRFADQVMRMPDPETFAASAPQQISRKSTRAGAPHATAPAPLIVHDVLRSPGRPLDAETRAFMEPRLASDLGGVRVHSDARAGESARAVGARAFAVGQDLVFGAGEYAPATPAGRRLLAHELAHTSQQSGNGPLSGAPLMVQRDGPDVPLKEAKKEDAVDPIVGGVKTAAAKFADDPKLKQAAIDTATALAGPIWSGATTADKAAIVAGGAAIVGTGTGALLGNPIGRKDLSGLPIGAPLSLVPYAIFSGFSYDLPKTKLDPLLLHLSFKGDDLLDLVRTKVGRLPKMTLSFDMTLSVAPGGRVTMPFGLAKFSPLPGVSLAGGYGVASDLPTLVSPPAGGPLAPYKAFPTPALAAPPAGAAVFVSVGFTKIDALKPILAPLVGDFGDKK